jgi:hypothetical protein
MGYACCSISQGPLGCLLWSRLSLEGLLDCFRFSFGLVCDFVASIWAVESEASALIWTVVSGCFVFRLSSEPWTSFKGL